MKLNVNFKRLICICIVACLFTACGGKADNYYKEGLELFNNGDVKNASESLKKAVEEDPDNDQYVIDYATALVSMGEYSQARQMFEDVMKETENGKDQKINKKAYRGVALTYFYEGDYRQAKAYFELAVNIDILPEFDNDMNAYLAECLMYLGDYNSSLKAWNEVIKLYEKDNKKALSNCYLGRASVNAVKGDTQEAIEDYNASIDNDKYCYSAYLGLYNLLVEMENYDEAGNVIGNAISLMEDKKLTDTLDYAIMIYYRDRLSGNTNMNVDELVRILDSGNKEALYYIGRVYQDNEDYENALTYFEDYINEFPGKATAEFCNQYAICLLELEKYDDALVWITKASTISGGIGKKSILFNEVVINEKLGKFDVASEKAIAYMDEYPDDDDMKKEYEFIKTRITDPKEN